ncbi:MAG: ectoine/hydroxyectoine ABC transporter permease subunit EhuD [Betaproteobacteria bacterium RIFCSPLOWO2_12_FULL_62_13]|nr:MAG: ectoine/hydroxyectoine ABC transporter permease subunit EhuD [Betaproteobacteria bacterium RIFCSPLOWO2_12_FULL_62_13]
MIFDWKFAWQIAPTLGEALVVTVQATVLGMLIAMSLGLALAVARRSRSRLVSWPIALFIEFTRSTPLLVQIYFLFYVLPAAGVRFSPLATGIVALGVHYSAYCSEVYRAGIEGIPKGQWEAATALNLSRWHLWRDIVVPQAIPPVVPALGNYLVAMFKDTPLLSAITVLEVLQTAKIIGSETFRYVEPLTITGALFLVLSLGSATLIRRVEKWLKVRGA